MFSLKNRLATYIMFIVCFCTEVNANFICSLLLYISQCTFTFWHGCVDLWACLSACLPSFLLLLDDGPSHTLYQPSETVSITAGMSITENR